MSQTAIFNVKDAQHFARVLDEESKEMAAQTRAIIEKLAALRATWKDSKFDEFSRLFDEATGNLRKFTEHAGAYADYLRKKAELTDVYLKRRF